MKLGSSALVRYVAVAAGIAITPSIGFAQLPNARSSTQAPPPVPTVVRPAEGQVIAGDLGITVQVPPGVRGSKYSIEAAYWDAAKNTWVYPGLLAPDFAGGSTATTTIADAVRQKINHAATRWRVHVHSVDPPGGWGPWREFTWEGVPPVSGGGVVTRTTATDIGTKPSDADPRGAPLIASSGAKPAYPSPGPPNAPVARAAGAKADPKWPDPGPPDARSKPASSTRLPDPGPPTAPTAKYPNPGPPSAPTTPAAGDRAGTAWPDPGPPTAPTVPSGGKTKYPDPGPPSAAAPRATGAKSAAAYPNPGPPNAPLAPTAAAKAGTRFPDPGPPGAPTAAPSAAKAGATYPDPGPPNAPSAPTSAAKAGAAYPNPGPPGFVAGATQVQTAAGLLRWFDSSVSSGNIVGTGVGNAASGRIGEVRKMLASIRSAIESGRTGDACTRIQSLHLQAPKLLKGTDARELLNRISALRGQLGCM